MIRASRMSISRPNRSGDVQTAENASGERVTVIDRDRGRRLGSPRSRPAQGRHQVSPFDLGAVGGPLAVGGLTAVCIWLCLWEVKVIATTARTGAGR
jgi:hypothetical protein